MRLEYIILHRYVWRIVKAIHPSLPLLKREYINLAKSTIRSLSISVFYATLLAALRLYSARVLPTTCRLAANVSPFTLNLFPFKCLNLPLALRSFILFYVFPMLSLNTKRDHINWRAYQEAQ